MKIKVDEAISQISLTDDFSPNGKIVFDYYPKDRIVSVYQDSDSPLIHQRFESIDESAEFEINELIKGLKEVIERLEELK